MPDDREPLGRLVHETRLAAEADHAAAEGRVTFLLGSWEERTEHQHELDMRIGSAVAAEARRDCEAELIRLRTQLLILAAQFPAFRDALVIAIRETSSEQKAKPFRVALGLVGGGGEGESRG